ncbi:acyltransferase [Rhizobium sp. BK602]|uniref:acyltransferase family protein n=1 Tax=Rhizobium sp. BK602 TaxID=2586986 RepID=UPI0016152EEB|nr:acyltransferase [Rhizobium sp. BK602]MBB3608073.1 peptidoglycan/LPS O-acetylase OafA/YrhL [Rhizobium sp. BK602]
MKYVREFEALRGLLAIWVLVGHVASAVAIHGRLFQERFYNEYAVDVFIILSGFAITALIDKRPEPYRLYIARRALRIFPAYLFYLAISVTVAAIALQIWTNSPDGSMKAARIGIAADTLAYWPWHLLAHVTGLHGLVPPRLLPSTDYAFLGQAWSISLEWQFYLVAPLLIGLVARPISWLRITLLVLLMLAISAILPKLPQSFLGKWLVDFGIGIASFYFMKHRALGEPFLQSLPLPQLWLVGVGLCILQRSVAYLPLAIWLTAILVIVSAREGRGAVYEKISALACSRPLQWLGGMAYSLYLSHMLVLLLALATLPRMGLASPWEQALYLLTATLAGTLVVSRLSYLYIERPFHEFGRNLGRGGRAAAEPSELIKKKVV